MLYQPENLEDCLLIECVNCIITNPNLCIMNNQQLKFKKLSKDNRYVMINNYAKMVKAKRILKEI